MFCFFLHGWCMSAAVRRGLRSSYRVGYILNCLFIIDICLDVVPSEHLCNLQALHLQNIFIFSPLPSLKITPAKTSIFVCSHRSRDDERMSKPASTPAKLAEEVPLPKPMESAVAREEKQLPPLPGQGCSHQPLNSVLVCALYVCLCV